MSFSRFAISQPSLLFVLRYLRHLRHVVEPAVHDDSGTMGGEDDLYIGVKFEYQVDEPLLPFDVETHLGLVHEEHVVLPVLDEHGKQDDQHLLLAAGELIRHERLADLFEANFVLRAHDLLACLGEEVVDEILELPLRLADALGLLGSLGCGLLQGLDHAVADIDLVVEILPLQFVDLPVEFGDEGGVDLVRYLRTHQRAVERADDVETYPACFLRRHTQADPLDGMARQLAATGQAPHHLVEDGTLSHTVDAAQDVDLSVQLPADVLLAAPERVDLYLLDVFSIFLHNVQV